MINESGWKDYDLTVKGQFDAATPTHSAWVSANAGSGKTKVLIDRVARLLLNGVQPDAIMCVTYTKAAASEMQGRLFKRLGGWCVADDHELAKQLSELQARNINEYTIEELGKARELLRARARNPRRFAHRNHSRFLWDDYCAVFRWRLMLPPALKSWMI